MKLQRPAMIRLCINAIQLGIEPLRHDAILDLSTTLLVFEILVLDNIRLAGFWVSNQSKKTLLPYRYPTRFAGKTICLNL